jgi:U3 small nucleolar RNA-associated protein 22
MFVDEHVEYLKEAAVGADHLSDACVLLKVWAARRGLLAAPDGFTGFLLSMMLTYLVSTGGKLNPLMVGTAG